jgi:hypothetical protein
VLVATGPAARLPVALRATGRRVADGWELDVPPAELQAALRALLAAGVEVRRVEPRER